MEIVTFRGGITLHKKSKNIQRYRQTSCRDKRLEAGGSAGRKPMSAVKTFVDTNVLIYAFTSDEPEKQDSALKALLSEDMQSGQIIDSTLMILNPFGEGTVSTSEPNTIEPHD